MPNSESLTMADKAIGTVYYISPEQASNRNIDARSDIYSLGAMLYEMVTGKMPFTADSPVAIIMQHIQDPPASPSKIAPGIPKGLEQIILCAMEKNPRNRYQSAAQMLRHLRRLKMDEKTVFNIMRPAPLTDTSEIKIKKTTKRSHGHSDNKDNSIEVKKTTPKTETKPEPVKPKEQPKPKESVKAVEPPKKQEKTIKKEEKKTPKSEPKPAPKTEPVKEQPQKKKSDGLKSLLASVEDIKKNARPSTTVQDTQETGQEVQEGIDGGTEGSLMQPLTISEKDLIANKLRGCWNVDAGLSGIENMIVEVRAYVNRDGSIRDVKILNMRSDPAFRSVAESARRAIYICENTEDSPFKMLAEKRSDSYQGWKEIFVRFNPLDGGVY
jgi:serine/threonine protein kinase